MTKRHLWKESYEAVELPEGNQEKSKAKKQKQKTTKKNKTSDSHESEESLNNKFESEYNDLVDMKSVYQRNFTTNPIAGHY